MTDASLKPLTPHPINAPIFGAENQGEKVWIRLQMIDLKSLDPCFRKETFAVQSCFPKQAPR